MGLERYKVAVPLLDAEGVRVERFTVDRAAADFDELRCLFSGGGMNFGRNVPPGEYTQLLVDDVLWMSDTPAEVADLRGLFAAVRLRDTPDVLLHGLGLGVALQGCFLEGAASVTVVECDERVLRLVGEHWRGVYGASLELVHGDALTWQPARGRRWTLVWHDIWSTLCEDNISEMETLHRRFGGRCEWQGSWSRDVLEARGRIRRRRSSPVRLRP